MTEFDKCMDNALYALAGAAYWAKRAAVEGYVTEDKQWIYPDTVEVIQATFEYVARRFDTRDKWGFADSAANLPHVAHSSAVVNLRADGPIPEGEKE